MSEMGNEQAAMIELPHDYDSLYGVQGLNQEIHNLLIQVIAAKDAEKSTALVDLGISYSEELEAKDASFLELSERLTELKHENEEQGGTIAKLMRELHEANEGRRDAEEKRDNAVRQAEEDREALDKASADNKLLRESNDSLKRQINELEGMLRTYRTAKPSGGLKLTSNLPAATEHEKRELSRMDIINKGLLRFGLDPLNLPPLPSAEKDAEPDVTEEDVADQTRRVQQAAEADEATFQVVHGDAGANAVDGGTEEVEANARATDETAAPTVEELAAQIADLQAWRTRIDAHLFPHQMNKAV